MFYPMVIYVLAMENGPFMMIHLLKLVSFQITKRGRTREIYGIGGFLASPRSNIHQLLTKKQLENNFQNKMDLEKQQKPLETSKLT